MTVTMRKERGCSSPHQRVADLYLRGHERDQAHDAGRARSFSVQHGERRLSGMKEGSPITVERNEAGHVIEIRKVG
jgi:hypothetical protein